MDVGYILIAAGVFLLALVLFWRQRKSDRWQASGRCYQCGASLGFDSKAVTLRFKAPSPAKHVNFCGRCARHRTIWSYLVGAMVVLFVALVWYGFRSGGYRS